MDLVLTLLVMGGMVGGALLFIRWQTLSTSEASAARAAGQAAYQRSGDYPSSCSWCKNTALARKLFMFERTNGSWRSSDVSGRLQRCADTDVSALASALVVDQPRWKRFCTEKCTREFFAAETNAKVEAFEACAYCSVRFPMALTRCPNCGAVRREP